jgi:hypothetical protein
MIQEIVFADHLFHDMFTGEKRFTIRRGRRAYVLGDCRFVGAQSPEEFNAKARIVSLKCCAIKDFWPDECEMYGYVDRLNVLEALGPFYSKLTFEEPMTIVEFEIIEHSFEEEYDIP